MAGKSNAMEDDVLNHQYRTATWSKPSSVWAALFTADPTDAGTLTNEVTGGGYARVEIPCLDANWNAPADDGSGNQRITNAGAITFPTPSGNWTGPITHVATMSAASGGTVRHVATLTTPRTVNNGDQAPTFAAGALAFGEG